MYVFLSVLIIIAAIFLILIVLVQNSKGGGLAANFQSSNQIMGVRRTADFLEKATWTLATVLVVLSVLSSIFITRTEEAQRSLIEEQVEEAIDPSALPEFPPPTIPEEQGANDEDEE
ncbi:MAG: preprotein translocase subunit SecG [Bacteroidota bacterium]